MSTDAHGERMPVPRRRGPAFGEVGPHADVEREETAGPLDRRTEAVLAFAIVVPALAAYTAIISVLYLAASALVGA